MKDKEDSNTTELFDENNLEETGELLEETEELIKDAFHLFKRQVRQLAVDVANFNEKRKTTKEKIRRGARRTSGRIV